MTLPSFLIIGSMKSGTTTLYRDLDAHPRVFFPIDKEPSTLATEPDKGGWDEYRRLFEPCEPDQIAGEASTAYTKRPTFEGVAERARRLLGPDLRLLYIVRNPIDRMLSHHYHNLAWGQDRRDADQAIRDNPEYTEFSCYAHQIEPWLQAFPRQQLRVVRFEDYTAGRDAGTRELFEFLGLAPPPRRHDHDAVHNRGDERVVHRGLVRSIVESGPYRKLVRPLMPVGIKDRLRRTLGSAPPPRPEPPTRETLERARDRIRSDLERLPGLLGQDAPEWDLEAAIERALQHD